MITGAPKEAVVQRQPRFTFCDLICCLCLWDILCSSEWECECDSDCGEDE
jgi:hypothetical protein